MKIEKTKFGIVGSGWRSEFFLYLAKSLPNLFEVTGIVSRREERRQELKDKWGVNVFSSIEDLLNSSKVDFIVMAVNKKAASTVIKEISSKGVPLLAETPPGITIDELIDLYKSVSQDAKILIAEQYHLQPMNQARLSLIQSKILGDISYTQISISHGYHGISLIRKILGIGFKNPVVSAKEFKFPIVKGPNRDGDPQREEIIPTNHIVATLDFNGKVGLFDFENNQHRSWIRSGRFLVRGSKGEINNFNVKYLKDFKTPINYELSRVNTGEYENLEGYFLKGILGRDEWLFRNPFVPVRFSDEEIAIATCLIKMKEYVKTGISFYNLSEALQDQYLALLIKKSIKNNNIVDAEQMPWQK